MSSIFLSHSHEDNDFARRLGASLRREGHFVWIDEAQILVGESLIEKIREGIDRVDYVVAVISLHSIKSKWVQKELDIASIRELDENRVIVLPVLVDDVDMPGFLKGKLYADFREGRDYDESLALLIRSLGPAVRSEEVDFSEKQRLRREFSELKEVIGHHERELERHYRLVTLNRSKKLNEAIEKENAEHPEWRHINEAYAFEVFDAPVTLGYVLHSIAKEERKGASALALGLTLEDKWAFVKLMLEAYGDFVGLQESSKDSGE